MICLQVYTHGGPQFTHLKHFCRVYTDSDSREISGQALMEERKVPPPPPRPPNRKSKAVLVTLKAWLWRSSPEYSTLTEERKGAPQCPPSSDPPPPPLHPHPPPIPANLQVNRCVGHLEGLSASDVVLLSTAHWQRKEKVPPNVPPPLTPLLLHSTPPPPPQSQPICKSIDVLVTLRACLRVT